MPFNGAPSLPTKPGEGEILKHTINCKTTDKDEEVRIEITDTGGTEKFRTVTVSEYQGVEGVIHVFDLNNQKSLDSILLCLKDSIRYADAEADFFVVGNKKDLERVVPKADEIKLQITEYMKKLEGAQGSPREVHYMETTCKEGDSVMQAMNEIATILQCRTP